MFNKTHGHGRFLYVDIIIKVLCSVRVSHPKSEEEKWKAEKWSVHTKMKELKAEKQCLANEKEHQKKGIDN